MTTNLVGGLTEEEHSRIEWCRSKTPKGPWLEFRNLLPTIDRLLARNTLLEAVIEALKEDLNDRQEPTRVSPKTHAALNALGVKP
jgi:hypothetical protein